MTTLINLQSKSVFGENRWRRIELNNFAKEYSLSIEGSNEEVYNRTVNNLSEYIIKIGNPIQNNFIASFDFDHTLVKPKNGRTFPKDVDDWEWLRPSVITFIKEKYNSGFSIFIFTTQTKEWKLKMLKNSLSTLNIPMTIVVGFGKNIKKPDPKLFYNVISEFDKERSFFVGDACGEGSWSDSDLQFAKNVGINFFTPEQVFPISIEFNKDTTDYTRNYQEIVIMIGYMASGKSSWCKSKLSEYTRIDGNTLKTVPKMIKAAIPFILNGKSIVFDATNGKLKNRQLIYDLAKKYNIKVRCVVIQTTIEQAMELNKKRAIETDIKKISNIAFYTFRKYYEEPTLDEYKNLEILKVNIL